MALQMNYYYPLLDVTIMNAYWRINPNDGIMGGKNKVNYTIEIFKNANAAHADFPQAIERQTYVFIPNISTNSPNLIEQAYNHAKSLPYFGGSVDV